MTNIVAKLWGFYHTLRYDGSTRRRVPQLEITNCNFKIHVFFHSRSQFATTSKIVMRSQLVTLRVQYFGLTNTYKIHMIPCEVFSLLEGE
jgi:hypothetical protein